MTITIGSFSTNALTAQPFGYEGDARTGLTARTFRINGLLTSSQWQALISEYDTWRSTRITDADTLSSASVGTTVNLTISYINAQGIDVGINGLKVNGLACWFTEPPSGEQAGAYISASVTLVDAAQALAVLLREKEKSRQNTESATPDLGTVTLGSSGVVITLTKPMDTREQGPKLALTVDGKSYVTGTRSFHKVRQIEGYISSGTYSALLAYYDDIALTSPNAGSWFPTTAPSATAEVVIAGGVKSTRYNVQLTLMQVV